MRLQDIVIGIIIFSAVIIAGTSFAVNLGNNYNVKVDSSFEKTYNKMTETYNLASDIQNKTEDAPIDETVGLVGMAKKGYEAMKMIFEAPFLLFTIFGDLSNKLGLPGWTTTTAISIILVIISFTVAKALFRWDF